MKDIKEWYNKLNEHITEDGVIVTKRPGEDPVIRRTPRLGLGPGGGMGCDFNAGREAEITAQPPQQIDDVKYKRIAKVKQLDYLTSAVLFKIRELMYLNSIKDVFDADLQNITKEIQEKINELANMAGDL
jgi:hypothetical protein